MASPDGFGLDLDDVHDGLEAGGSETLSWSGLELQLSTRRAARRELRWFYTRMRGRVPAVGEAPAPVVAAASRIAGWLSELRPPMRGAFVVRYDRRRWPVRLLRTFGGITSVVVRFAAMRAERGPSETLEQAEGAVVAELLADIAAAGGTLDALSRDRDGERRAKRLRRLRRAATKYVRIAEHAYFDARGRGPCVAPVRGREGA